MALKLLAATRDSDVLGISASAANSTLARTQADLAKYAVWTRFDPDSDACPEAPRRGSENTRRRLVILALGPATNIPSLIKCFDFLEYSVDEILFVGGRQDGEEFWLGSPLRFFRPMRDLNYETDRKAFRRLLATGIKIALIPFRAGNAVRLDLSSVAPVLDDQAFDAVRNWIAALSLIGAEWTMPAFDPTAAAYLIWPSQFECFAANLTRLQDQFVVDLTPAGQQQLRWCHPSDPDHLVRAIGYVLRHPVAQGEQEASGPNKTSSVEDPEAG